LNLFKGYIPSKNKVPLSAIKGGTYLAEPPLTGDYVGVLKENIIQLDFDSQEDSEKILKVVEEYKLRCDILKTTRGVHLYFINDDHTKSQSVGIFNAMGIHCDVGLGTKDRVIPLRTTKITPKVKMIDGEKHEVNEEITTQREWLQTYTELEAIPPFLRPFGKFNYEFGKTEARNQTLFDYILQMQARGYSKADVRKTIKAINKFMLYEPLSDREIDVITRDDAFSEEIFYTEKGRFLHHVFGDYMLANSNILLIDKQVHIYTTSGLYSNDPFEFEKQMLEKIPSLKDSHRKEVFKYLELKAKRSGEFAPPKYIGLRDTILNIEEMKQVPYSPNWVIGNRIHYGYNPTAYDEHMDRTLNKVACNDPQIRALLEEMIGYSLFRANTMQQAFILTGEGSNGKSTILEAIKRLLGKDNYSSLEMHDLEDAYRPAEMYNKLANIGDDISNKYMNNSSIFKKAVTGESFVVAKKYGQPFELESYATQIFCANELPQVNDKTDGFSRRIVIVPFNAKFSKHDADYDPFIKDKLMEDSAMEYLLKIAIDGLKRVIINRQFTKSDESEREMREYNLLNNNVLEWLRDIDVSEIDNHSVSDVYKRYSVWCSDYGAHAVKKANLSKELKKQFNLVSKPKSLNGKTTRVYVKE